MGNVVGPDFICVGMPKAGTGWLFDRLSDHPDFWMPLKGLHYLRKKYPKSDNSIRRLAKIDRIGRLRVTQTRECESRDREFLKEIAACRLQPRDLSKYASFFRHKGNLLTGDITAAYADLEEDVISEIADVLPDVKIVFLVRDPVARAWSRISMEYRAGKFDPTLLENPESFRKWASTADCLAAERSLPTDVISRWTRCAPKVQFRHFFFDDIEKRPDEARRDILKYIGADPDKELGDRPAGDNRKANAKKLTLTEPIRQILVDRFKDELFACAASLGGPAVDWPKRYGLQ